MSEKWLVSRCEGYAVHIDEVSARLQAPIIEYCAQAKRPRKNRGLGYAP